MLEQLEQLYQEARSALKAKDYDRASGLLRQILQIDENYKDASRLLAQTVKLRRRRWYNHPLLWGTVGALAIIILGIVIAPKLNSLFAKPTPPSQTATVQPTSMVPPTDTPVPTETAVPAPTAIPLTWKRAYIGQEFTRDTVNWFGIDPKDTDILFIHMERAGDFISIDGGSSWQPIQANTFPNGLYKKGKTSRDALISNTGLDGKARTYSRKTANWFVSEDKGNTWSEFGIVGKAESNAITFDAEGWVYVYCDSRLCKYSPDGKQRITLGKPDVGAFTVIAISPHDPDILYVAGSGMAVSKDGGFTWTKLNNGLGSEILQLVVSKGADPALYLQSGTCHEEKRNNTTDYYGQPLYRSMDGGHTWTLSIEAGCHLVKDADERTIYRTGSFMALDEKTYRGWLWRSSDGGTSWEKVLTPDLVMGLVAHPTRSGELGIYAESHLTGRPQLFTSNDYGHTWAKQTALSTRLCYGYGPSDLYAYRSMPISLSIDPRDINHVLYVINGETFESTDNCFNSTELDLHIQGTNSIAFDTNNPETLYAGTDNGAYISFDAGQSWNQINDGLLGATVVYSIVVDKENNVYAATPYGIFKLESK